jgi:hypothetical protein
MLILSVFLDKKSSKYFPRTTHFKLAIFEFAAVLSGGRGAAAMFSNFEYPANGGGGRRLVIEALSSSGSGHICPAPFFSFSALLTVADSPHAAS